MGERVEGSHLPPPPLPRSLPLVSQCSRDVSAPKNAQRSPCYSHQRESLLSESLRTLARSLLRDS